jgi:hypothetical protein
MRLDRRFVLGRLVPVLATVALVTGAVMLAKASGGAESGALCREAAPNFDPAWPMTTLTDLVSYSDQLSVVTVASEKALSPLVESDENGGMVGRSVDLVIDRTLWRRDGAPTVSGRVSTIVDPWMVDGDDARPWYISGGARLEVGDRYLVPLTQVKDEEGVGWTTNGEDAVYPLNGSTIVCGKVREEEFANEDVSGWTVDDFAARFAATDPDPLAVKYGRLDVHARWNAVAQGQ